jgi:hypothetical protein
MENDKEQYSAYQWCKAELRRMHKTGEYAEDPEFWHPAARLARLAETTVNESLRLIALKTLLEFVEMPKAAQARLEAGSDGPAQITITVAAWAAGTQPRAIEHHRPVDYVQGDPGVQAHRGAPPPAPAPEPAPFVEYDMVRDGGGVERPVAVEVPQSDFKPTRYRFDERTASYIEVAEDDDGR